MELLMLGLNHKTAPVDVRERFSIPKAAVKSGLANLGEYEGGTLHLQPQRNVCGGG